MSRAGIAAGVAAMAAVTTVMVILGLTALAPAVPEPQPIFAAGDMARKPTSEPLRLDALAGPAPASAYGVHDEIPVIVLKIPRQSLETSAAFHGYNTAQYAVPFPDEPGMVLVAYGAKSTHLGCVVRFHPAWDINTSFKLAYEGVEGVLMDPCSQSMFDPYDLARNREHMPAPRPLDAIAIAIMADDVLGVVERFVQQAPRDADQDTYKGFRIVGQTS